ncbi:MAG: hypothetical protein F6K17_31260 [Okeania sp. SIO3C4]|nr:hypothetical protein [Okeania sp. SIO3C4]
MSLTLRLTSLTTKPIWSDEFSTLVFSLGKSFQTIPLDKLISLDTLLSPLQIDTELGITSVAHNLLNESNHPPIYFMLTNWWVKLFSSDGEFVSLWGARSLSAIFGTFSVPAIFLLSLLAFRSPLVGQIAGALMAVSPFGIYLAQETRHYTLAILFVIASLGFFIVAIDKIQQKTPLPFWMVFAWVIVNALGIAVHFFFPFTLCAQGLVFLWFWIRDWRQNYPKLPASKIWQGIYTAALGTAISGIIWIPIFIGAVNSNSGLVDWTSHGDPIGQFIEPIARMIVWWITMIAILPVENQPLFIIIISVLIMLGITGLTVWLLIKNYCYFPKKWQLSWKVLTGLVTSNSAIIILITYGLSIDLTLVARYQFVHFPAIIILISVGFAGAWENRNYWQKKAVIFIGTLGLISSFIVVNNLAYQKPDRSDLVVSAIAKTLTPEIPKLIATVEKTHEQTGEMMSIAWELKKLIPSQNYPMFLLAHKSGDSTIPVNTLNQTLAQLPKPLNLWVVNFAAPFQPETQNCIFNPESKSRVSGYYFRMYQCQ